MEINQADALWSNYCVTFHSRYRFQTEAMIRLQTLSKHETPYQKYGEPSLQDDRKG
jgi:hypothetical protein